MMVGSEAQLYYEVAELFFPEFKNESRTYLGYRLDKLLGITEYREYSARPHQLDKPMSEELKQLLLSLKSPHRNTLLKVYLIRKAHDQELAKAHDQELA